MDFTLLQSWLRLPAGSWPPNHYVLLGLPEGSRDPEVLERHVLERMDVLRRHQLRHPEVVTAGMNQLAQALNCLGDADERAAYDAQLDLVVPLLQPEAPIMAEVPPSPDPIEAPLVQAVAAGVPASIRWICRRRAAIRKSLRAWDALATSIAVPEEYLDRPAIAFHFLLATRDARPLLAELRGVFEDQHVEVDLLLRTLAGEDPVKELRNQSPEARSTLAVQWMLGRTALDQEMERLQAMIPRGPRDGVARFTGRLARRIDQSPELILVLLVAIALATVLLRSSFGR